MLNYIYYREYLKGNELDIAEDCLPVDFDFFFLQGLVLIALQVISLSFCFIASPRPQYIVSYTLFSRSVWHIVGA